MSILIIAAHPDDEVLGCGGTISKLVSQNKQIFVAILGQGLTSRKNDPNETSQKEISKLKSQSKNAMEFLGVSDLHMFDFPDNRFDTVPLLEIVKTIEDLVKKIQPRIIFTHHAGDLNIDHTITHRAVITATRPMNDCPVKEILAFEVPSSTEWSFEETNQFVPNYFIDITGHLDRKTTALNYYTSEIQQFPHPRSNRYVEALAEIRGSAVGRQHCEAFSLIRKLDE